MFEGKGGRRKNERAREGFAIANDRDFLFKLATTKSSAALLTESKWDKTIAAVPALTADQTAQIAKRHAAVKSALAAYLRAAKQARRQV